MLTILAGVSLWVASGAAVSASAPRVFVFTDINIDQGDPDDRQSLVHLLWYANELRIEGIVPERWAAESRAACDRALAAYAQDYAAFEFGEKGYPRPSEIAAVIAKSDHDAIQRFKIAVEGSSERNPLYVLVWGNMRLLQRALDQTAWAVSRIRLVTIGTHLLLERDRKHLPADWPVTEQPCRQPNWNGAGRNDVFNDPRFKDLWWIEMNWTYAGMFTGDEPATMFQQLRPFGALGEHIHEVVARQPWARYFRVGDTPSVLYLVDPNHDREDPTQSSWAGRFHQPFPYDRPHYFTDDAGSLTWDYADPCVTWPAHLRVYEHAKSTLEQRRAEMYAALLRKLSTLYPTGN